jgi:hypothetical protein
MDALGIVTYDASGKFVGITAARRASCTTSWAR